MAAAKTVKRWCHLAKQTVKKKARSRKPQTEKPLPPPVDPGASSELPLPEPESQGSGLFNLGAIFQSQSQQPSSADSSIPSATSSNANGEPMAADAARLLDSVPERIGDDGTDAPPQGEAPDTVRVTISQAPIVVDAETVRVCLLWLTEKLAIWRKVEAYRIGEHGAEILAPPYTKVLNALFEKLMPAFVTQFAMSVPGLAEAAVLSAIVFGPAFKEEMKRGRAVHRVPPQKPDVQQPEPPRRGGMIYEGGKTE